MMTHPFRALGIAGSWLLLAASLAAPLAGQAGQAGQVEAYAGRSLQVVLVELQRGGLPLIFTDQLVGPELRVEREPVATAPRSVAAEILAPHGLGLREGPGGALVVVPVVERPRGASDLGGLEGTVLDQATGRPVGGVEVRLPGHAPPRVTGPDGRFRFAGLEAGFYTLEIQGAGYLPQETTQAVRPSTVTQLRLELVAVPTTVEAIQVLSRRQRIPGDEMEALTLGEEDRRSLPRLADDALRTFGLLPGVATSELSAQPQVRGGRADEVTVRLDGFELLQPYHLRDFGNALSIVADATVARAQLLAGGYPVEYGDRMGGVLDLTTVDPSWRRRTSLGAGIFDAHLASSGTLAADRGHWFAQGRRSTLEVPLTVGELKEEPRFWDLFAKVDRSLAKHALRASTLVAEDDLSFEEEQEGTDEQVRSDYGNRYLWLTDFAVLSPRTTLETQASASWIARDRNGERTAEEGPTQGTALVQDRRDLAVFGLNGRWQGDFGSSRLGAGWDVRRVEAEYDYRAELPAGLAGEVERRSFERRFEGEQLGVFLSETWSGPRASLEVGVRYDENTVTDDEDFSPRLGLVWQLAERSRLRLAWGRFFQSQRLYELQVEDGVTQFQRAEEGEDRILGFEHRFAGPGDTGESRLATFRLATFRLELYERRIRHPRLRFENLFDPVTKLPELEADRVAVAAETSRSRGVEVFLTGSLGHRLDWQASYSHSRAQDRLPMAEGPRSTVSRVTVPRSTDQPHAGALQLSWRGPRGWDLGLAARAHTGWPTTAVSAELVTDEDGSVRAVPRLGPIYGERLSPYFRLDAHVAREWTLRRGRLRAFLDVQNLTHRRNQRGFEVSAEIGPGGEPRAVLEEERWAGILPAFGVTWTF